MTKIDIHNLTVNAKHGVFDKEKVNPQPFVFDCSIDYDFEKAAVSDDLALTLDYGGIMQDITDFCKSNCFDLIETLCYKTAQTLMDKYPINSISLTVKKPQAPVDLPFENVSVSVTLERKDAYLSLGSNLGERQEILNNAINQLAQNKAVKVLKISSPYENPPYGGVAQYPFINMAVKISTYLSPDALLDYLHAIEEKAHRTREARWGDRTLDIDIIYYGDMIIDTDRLTIPHADYHNRDFVLIPMGEIAPNFVCPLKRKRIFELLNDLSK